ncbi:PadR family transcriptional regulator [Cellulomonas sp. H30R-01]|uniref:PadR family transcriptional regulator n=2 Tax=Cellulomonas TaxID=1707 RepID=A0A401V049_9CELL|nr:MULTISPECIES: PadR family transcriptional regulator [Cellulomonas]NKY40523.1 PadR family transcriptional regulator [Cellulomonas septica]QHT57421.1 PadR family transcriptional regulator [Cellulomonas sp. H30R-01]GCD20224.1 PadR family transcriptional regulator [Cellulomonas algicola]
MAGRGRSNPLALAVLTLLWERPMHPYEMSMTLRERRKDETVRLNFGSLYSVVEGLEKRGLIEAASTEREGNRPTRTVYRITDAGATEAVDWLSDLVRTPVKEFPQFEAALSFLPLLAPDDVARLLRMRAASVRTTLTSLETTVDEARRQGLPRIFALEAEYEIGLLRAELDFVVGLEASISDGTLEHVDMWRSLHARTNAAGRIDPDELAEAVADALSPFLSGQEGPPDR